MSDWSQQVTNFCGFRCGILMGSGVVIQYMHGLTW